MSHNIRPLVVRPFVVSLVIKDLVYEAEAKTFLKAKTLSAKAKTLSVKAKAKTFMRCSRRSSRPRPGLEDNSTVSGGLQKFVESIL